MSVAYGIETPVVDAICEGVVAGDEIKQGILKTGIRKLEGETRLSHHTIRKLSKAKPFDANHLPQIVREFTKGVSCGETTESSSYRGLRTLTRTVVFSLTFTGSPFFS